MITTKFSTKTENDSKSIRERWKIEERTLLSEEFTDKVSFTNKDTVKSMEIRDNHMMCMEPTKIETLLQTHDEYLGNTKSVSTKREDLEQESGAGLTSY